MDAALCNGESDYTYFISCIVGVLPVMDCGRGPNTIDIGDYGQKNISVNLASELSDLSRFERPSARGACLHLVTFTPL